MHQDAPELAVKLFTAFGAAPAWENCVPAWHKTRVAVAAVKRVKKTSKKTEKEKN